MAGRLILVHGASSSGKSTITRALQGRIEAPFYHLSIDHLRDSGVLPQARFRSGEFDWKAARPAFFTGFHEAVIAFARGGNDVILEHILDTDGFHAHLARLAAGMDVFFVGVHCTLDELIRREVQRADRPVGSAAADHARVHQGLRYDLELDGEAPVEDNVARLLDAWHSRTAPSAFFSLPEAMAGNATLD